MPTLRYFPLDVAFREIRLFIVRPAALNLRDSPLEVSLTKSRLSVYRKDNRSDADEETSLKYIALSYAWGDPQPTFSVLLDEMEFKVRKNMYEALLHFRPFEGELAIWIDAVCISQDDMQERESQVGLMRDIYREAEEVWAWLGQGDATITRSAFALLVDLAHREYSDVEANPRRVNDLQSETIECVKAKVISDASFMQWLRLASLLESPLFSRMWIIQEVVMGKTVTVMSGSFAVRFDEVIYYVGKFMQKYLFEADRKTSKAGQRNHLARELAWISYHLPTTTYQVARHFDCFNVTEPRDRVLEEFGNVIKCPTISCSIPLVNLYWDSIRLHIEHNREMDFLGDAVGLNKPCGIPTWMPQWYDKTADTDQAYPILALQLAPEIEYKAMANTLPICSFYPPLNAIRVAGFPYSVVREVGHVVTLQGSGVPIEESEAYFQIEEQLSRTLGQWVSKLDLDDVYNGQLPFIAKLDDSVPEEKRGKAYTFLSMICMIDEIYKWPCDKLYTLYERSVEDTPRPYFGIGVNVDSAESHFSTRQIAAMRNRRLFISLSNGFGLGPKDMQPGDMIVYLYGCRIPMVLRQVEGLRLRRIVGEAYCPFNMNGEMLKPEITALRATAGPPDMLFWII